MHQQHVQIQGKGWVCDVNRVSGWPAVMRCDPERTFTALCCKPGGRASERGECGLCAVPYCTVQVLYFLRPLVGRPCREHTVSASCTQRSAAVFWPSLPRGHSTHAGFSCRPTASDPAIPWVLASCRWPSAAQRSIQYSAVMCSVARAQQTLNVA